MKKKLVCLLALLLLVMALPLSVSAAEPFVIEDDFISAGEDCGALSMAKLYKLDSGENVRIKYAFGKGYCCPDGGGKTASLVYKVDADGGKFEALTITVKGHIASREGYNEGWTEAPSATVEVSADGNAYTKVATWKGDQLDMAQYPENNDFKNLSAKTYNADLKAAAGSASVVYVRLSWSVYDYPMYSSVHNVKLEGRVNGGNGVVGAGTPTTTTTTAATTTTTTEGTTRPMATQATTDAVDDVSGSTALQTEPTSATDEQQAPAPTEQAQQEDALTTGTEVAPKTSFTWLYIVLGVLAVLVIGVGIILALFGGGLIGLLIGKGKKKKADKNK